MDKKNLIAGILFLLGALILVIYLLTEQFQTFYVTGIVVFTLVGVAFLKRARRH